MLPLSTGNTKGCNPISSNCIVWQGPDLNCINVCNGDTISIVIAKIAELVCTLIDAGLDAAFDISGVNQNCFLNYADPALDLTELLNNIIQTACNNINQIDNINNTIFNLTENIEDIELIVGPVGPAGPSGCGVSNIITLYEDEAETIPSGSFQVSTGPPCNETYVVEGLEGIQGVAGPTGPGGPTGPTGPGGPGGPEGDPGNPGNIKVFMPKCIFNDIGSIRDNTINGGGEDISDNGDGFMLLTAFQNDGITPIANAYEEYITNDDDVEEIIGTYTGWTDFVSQKLCCILVDHNCLPRNPDGGGHGDVDITGDPGTGGRQPEIRNLPIITQLRNRIVVLERKGKAAYVPPKILARCVTNKVGKRVEMHELLSALEIDYCNLRKAIGGSSEVLKASRSQCINLASEDRLSGNGVMSTLPGWYNSPSNLSQSFSNAWKVICDMRTAVATLQTSVTPSGCSGFTYDPKLSLTKDISGNVSGIKFLFTSMVIPETYHDCDKVKGTKVTIEDSSLNQHVEYVKVTNLQSSANGHSISGLQTKGLDITSNFKVKIDFCFTDGSNQCERTMEFTLENSSACPTVTLSTTGETNIEYNVSGLSTTSKATYEVIVENSAGSVLSKQTITKPSTSTTTGRAGGLAGGTSYDIYVRTTSLAGNVSTCDKITFKTTSPVCTSYSKVATEYKTKIADLGNTKITLATYKSGATTTAWIIGFDTITGEPVVYKGTDSTETGTEATFVLNTTSISDNPTTSINCGNVAYPATGMTTLMNSNENGWQYIDALSSNSKVTYYVYALANTGNKSIDQIVFCCDCKPSYVRTKYGDTSTIATSEAYAPDKHSWYAITGKTLRIPIDIVGYSKQTTPIKWNATSMLGGTTTFVLPTDSGYDSSLGGTVQLNYTSGSTGAIAGIDSVNVYAETDCTVGNEGNRTVNTITIPIVDAITLPNTDTNVTVFIDANIVSTSEATVIKTEMERVKTAIQSGCSTWTGTFNYVPVGGNSSGDYLEYTKAMVDKANGGAGSITVSSGYSSFKSLPSYWSSGGTIPSSIYLICFIGDVNSKGNYGGTNLTQGWGVQPTAKYQQNYDEILDILFVNGSARTSWGVAQNCLYKKFDIHQILVPIVSGSQDASAATILQTAGALTGTVLSETGINGFPTGSVKNPVNIKDYIGPNASQMVPYTGTTVGASNTLKGLYNYGFRVMPFIDRSYLETDSNLQSGGDQSNFLGNAMKRIVGIDTSGMGLNTDKKCATGTNIVQPMSGLLNGTTVNTYGDNSACRTAGTTAESSGSCKSIYNSTGIQFDSGVPAYATLSAGNAGYTDGQLVDGRWYAQHGATTTDAVRRVAQYDRDGATTGYYWVNEQYVGDASCT